MALDVGDKTIGVAISDPLGMTVEPLTVIKRSEGVRADLRAVEALAHERDVSKIVVGIPIMLTGEEAVQAGKVRQFAQRLAGRLDIPVVMWDERLTTVEAERMLIEADQSRTARKHVVDKVAAAIILRSYLAANG